MEIPNFNNYIIYPDGRIYNKKLKLKTRINKKGYTEIVLSKKCKSYNLLVHRLLAKIYIENPNNLPAVDHYDGNKSNNCLSNLRWVSLSENSRNRKKSITNTSGHTGIRIEDRKLKYRATWTLPYDNKLKRQKTASKSFKTLEEAIEHRKKMEKIYYSR